MMRSTTLVAKFFGGWNVVDNEGFGIVVAVKVWRPRGRV